VIVNRDGQRVWVKDAFTSRGQRIGAGPCCLESEPCKLRDISGARLLLEEPAPAPASAGTVYRSSAPSKSRTWNVLRRRPRLRHGAHQPPPANPRAGREPGALVRPVQPGDFSPNLCYVCPQKESAMQKWLLLLWRRFRAWLVLDPSVPAHHHRVSEPYQPSNLHARHYR
jgi:hypothetical protein